MGLKLPEKKIKINPTSECTHQKKNALKSLCRVVLGDWCRKKDKGTTTFYKVKKKNQYSTLGKKQEMAALPNYEEYS